ncbi:putative RNA polymerase sporulation-specific sigma factor (sigma-K) (plasmid) [Phenylobacterium zucineum HLK1]|uniref:Putative RNA polymerase sporulation-specific sigma factor (Sigma-K) n=1 Tax=Phenylobacterium zucineum (strain HLK1) TaxID=450851 RepID=B4RIL1_PHEZH|nr:putative RNA polymerase sporulation-specific sigma factor (sigma-K) [Phenylobacterium zucineum HLK1]
MAVGAPPGPCRCSCPLRVGVGVMPAVAEHLDLLEGDQADVLEVIQLGQKGAQTRLLIDELDHDRQVVVQVEWTVLVQPRGLPKTFAAAQHGGAGEMGVTGSSDDHVDQRAVAHQGVLVGIDAKQDGLAG